MKNINEMIETYFKLSDDARGMGYESARLNLPRGDNPFKHSKGYCYAEVLVCAWFEGYDEYIEEVAD